MKIIGLTGSVASGKNFIAAQFEKLHVPVFDADKAVHKILSENKNVFKIIKKHFPKVIIAGKIDRKKLGAEVFSNSKKLNILEEIIHPEVRNLQEEFICEQRFKGAKMLVLNIPLLFEKGSFKRCNYVIAVITPKIVAQYRFLKRAGKNNSELNADLIFKQFLQTHKKQLSNHYKKKLADFIIYNGLDKGFAIKQTKKILNYLLCP